MVVPEAKVIKTLEFLGFTVIRERQHIVMERENGDGTKTPLTMPKHSQIKGSTLRSICSQASISREDFSAAYEQI
ncbi:type II toxin-antitoxin system HicA family toxin [Desmonostoc muscorum LEGE 12446]|uniref:type II toxin-antitoxin system HicA family toxin n=1 Tax=Desmonostoc muscorum TaxID=1179 RepID=UPI001D1424B7|nr:type II toxin-antitoxin system HicA family toxin [Desmonostoc muscorum]MCF2145837.1 type II toxin-antitoxin system HicA family toxin [Desmonostoc muscorum LEGE 12446]